MQTLISAKQKILDLHRELKAADSLAPCDSVNRLFTELVEVSGSSSHKIAHELLEDDDIKQIIPSLRSLSSDGEYELESYWANRILHSTNPNRELTRFPYLSNYQKLTELEFRSLNLTGNRKIKRALFVGSGPLPLSAILMARQYGIVIDNLDNDKHAVELSTQLVGALGLESLVNVFHEDATSFRNYGAYDVVFLASLVGGDQSEKLDLLTRISDQLRPGSLLVARSAHHLRTLLYPEVDTESLDTLKLQVVIHPFNEVINSVVIFEKQF